MKQITIQNAISWLKTYKDDCKGTLDKGVFEVAIDALEKKAAYEQVKWERDVAIAQLNEIGVGLGQKMDDIKRRLDQTNEDQWI